MGIKKKLKAAIQYPFEHGEVISYTVYLYTQSLQRYRRLSKLSCRIVRKPLREFTMRPMMTLKQSLTAVMMEEN
jgi:hypothetical protein